MKRKEELMQPLLSGEALRRDRAGPAHVDLRCIVNNTLECHAALDLREHLKYTSSLMVNSERRA